MRAENAGDGKPFPSQLRSSNTLFYSEIPTDVPAANYTWSTANSTITSSPDPSVRFWKEYIDFVIGVYQDPFGNIQVPGTSTCSYGPDFTAGTGGSGTCISISGPDGTIYINGLVGSVTYTGGGSGSGAGYSSSSATVTFSAPTTGTTATGTPIVSSGKITGVTITNPGSGYTSAPTITFGGSHTTAASAPASPSLCKLTPS